MLHEHWVSSFDTCSCVFGFFLTIRLIRREVQYVKIETHLCLWFKKRNHLKTFSYYCIGPRRTYFDRYSSKRNSLLKLFFFFCKRMPLRRRLVHDEFTSGPGLMSISVHKTKQYSHVRSVNDLEKLPRHFVIYLFFQNTRLKLPIYLFDRTRANSPPPCSARTRAYYSQCHIPFLLKRFTIGIIIESLRHRRYTS